jgi:septal ring factor EnvC (AmiA/AmiB activator)
MAALASPVGVALAVMLSAAGAAHAQSGGTYRCVDDHGRSTYTNVKQEMTGKKCTIVSREVSVVPADQPLAQPKASPASTAASFSSRASDRRKILEEELFDEEKRLGEARGKLAEQQAMRNGDQTNVQRVQDRLKPFMDTVEQHEKNIAQLKRELGSIR